MLRTLATIAGVATAGLIAWYLVGGRGESGISAEAAHTAQVAGRVLEIHPRGRADVVCFVLTNPGTRLNDSISCVKENPVQVEKK